jgi:prolyl-tRNA synthetase
VSEDIYQLAQGLGIEVLLDDRDKKTSPGVKFADSELIGIPHRLVISPRSLADGVIEYKRRGADDKQLLATETIHAFITTLASGADS